MTQSENPATGPEAPSTPETAAPETVAPDNKRLTVSNPGQPAAPPKARAGGNPKGVPVGGTGKLFRFDS